MQGIKAGPHFVVVGKRPMLQVEEVKLEDGTFVPGKEQNWMPLVTTFINTTPEEHATLFKLLAAYYQFGSKAFAKAESPHEMLKSMADKLGTGKLVLYDGHGNIMEWWILKNLWPHSINFGDLCYSSDPTVNMEVTWRFTAAEYNSPFLKKTDLTADN